MEDNKTEAFQKYDKEWAFVENALNDGTKSGYKIAVIETEKILKDSLQKKNFPGETMENKIEFIQKRLSNPDKLKYSRAMYKKIINETGFDISVDDTKDIIAGYYKAISDISRMNYYNISLKDKLFNFGEKYSNNIPSLLKNVTASLLLFFLVVLLSSETEMGQSFALLLKELSKFIFYRLIPAIILIVIFIFTTLMFISKMKKRRKH